MTLGGTGKQAEFVFIGGPARAADFLYPRPHTPPGKTGDVRRERTSVPFGLSSRYDNGKSAGTVCVETLL